MASPDGASDKPASAAAPERPAAPAAPGQTLPDQALPEQTTDDTDVGWGEATGAATSDERERWLLDERPPHW